MYSKSQCAPEVREGEARGKEGGVGKKRVRRMETPKSGGMPPSAVVTVSLRSPRFDWWTVRPVRRKGSLSPLFPSGDGRTASSQARTTVRYRFPAMTPLETRGREA